MTCLIEVSGNFGVLSRICSAVLWVLSLEKFYLQLAQVYLIQQEVFYSVNGQVDLDR